MSYFIQTQEGDRLNVANAAAPRPEVPRRIKDLWLCPPPPRSSMQAINVPPRFNVADRGVEGVLTADQIREVFL